MKRLLLIPLLSVAISFAYAQDSIPRKKERNTVHHSPEERAQRKAERMAKQLSLSKEQQEKIYELSLQHTKERLALAKEMREQSLQNRQEIENILSPEQKQKLKDLEVQQRSRREKSIKPQKRNFKRGGSMIKKPDSLKTRRPISVNPPTSQE